MNKLLEQAIEKIRALPDEDQELAAEMLQAIVNRRTRPYVLNEDERHVVERALAETDAGEFASDEEVRTVLNREWR